jgi:hypothetical protein
MRHEMLISSQQQEINEKNKKWLEKTQKTKEERMKKMEEDLMRKEKSESEVKQMMVRSKMFLNRVYLH